MPGPEMKETALPEFDILSKCSYIRENKHVNCVSFKTPCKIMDGS